MTAPAIRFHNFMGDSEDMNACNLVGPYPDVDARNADLRRLRSLPLGGPEFSGGQQYEAATMGDARGEPGWGLRIVDPARVAGVVSQRGFHAAFGGYDDVDAPTDPHEPHPDQAALFQ